LSSLFTSPLNKIETVMKRIQEGMKTGKEFEEKEKKKIRKEEMGEEKERKFCERNADGYQVDKKKLPFFFLFFFFSFSF
jgi:hypothetical protein